ncbi:MAG: hypothetical protein P4L83_10085 [Nevskia sp.]|nr:hypothetical protein [Nevskia sp.]
MKIPSEAEFFELIVETLNLDADVEITPETLLFGGPLDLNSVDALEIGAVINDRYKIKLDSKDEATRRAFMTIRTLHAFVAEKMQSKQPELSEANAA